MTNEEIEKYPFKYYDPARQDLSTLRANLRNLESKKELDLNQYKSKKIPTSKFQAEHQGSSLFNEGIYRTELCEKHPEKDDGDRIKTPLGWISKCCAIELNLSQLSNTKPQRILRSEEDISKEYEDRRHELNILISKMQKERTLKSVATRKANRLAVKQQSDNTQRDVLSVN